MAARNNKQVGIEVPEIEHRTATFIVVGETPLIFNALSEKAKRELLFPLGKKTQAQKKTSLKHNPITEYRNSVYLSNEDMPAALTFPATGFKKGMAEAALNIPGATKKDIGKLVRVHGYHIGIYGVPQLFMTGVRSADMNRTPDIRTRAILPQWACAVEVSWVHPFLTLQTVTNLFSAAGSFIGLGDGRQEKGAFDFGLYRLTKTDDAEYREIVAAGGREEQLLALKDPKFYDAQSQELFEWFEDEAKRRGVDLETGSFVADDEGEVVKTTTKAKKK